MVGTELDPDRARPVPRGVLEQVVEDGAEAGRVADDRELLRVAEREVHVRVAAARVGERGVGHVTDVHGLVRDRAGVAAGEGLERVEERGEPRHVALELRQDLLVRTMPECSDVGPNRSEWRAELVAGVGREPLGGGDGRLQPGEHRVERVGDLADFGRARLVDPRTGGGDARGLVAQGGERAQASGRRRTARRRRSRATRAARRTRSCAAGRRSGPRRARAAGPRAAGRGASPATTSRPPPSRFAGRSWRSAARARAGCRRSRAPRVSSRTDASPASRSSCAVRPRRAGTTMRSVVARSSRSNVARSRRPTSAISTRPITTNTSAAASVTSSATRPARDFIAARSRRRERCGSRAAHPSLRRR